jgi:hypothetical protein
MEGVSTMLSPPESYGGTSPAELHRPVPRAQGQFSGAQDHPRPQADVLFSKAASSLFGGDGRG